VRRSCRRAGYTLAGVMIFLVLVMFIWQGTLAQLGAYLRVEKTCQVQRTARSGYPQALAWGLTLLETGLPPESPYSCTMVSPVDSNDVFVTTFTQTAGVHYAVDVRLATEYDAGLPSAPDSFAGNSNNGNGHGQGNGNGNGNGQGSGNGNGKGGGKGKGRGE
jgi:uncharacterized membrane protein YgcG